MIWSQEKQPECILHTFRQGQVLSFRYENFSARGRAGGTALPSVNLGPAISRKLLELESQKFTNISMWPSSLFSYENFSARGMRGHSTPSVHLYDVQQ